MSSLRFWLGFKVVIVASVLTGVFAVEIIISSYGSHFGVGTK
jgi:hypothetical protein